MFTLTKGLQYINFSRDISLFLCQKKLCLHFIYNWVGVLSLRLLCKNFLSFPVSFPETSTVLRSISVSGSLHLKTLIEVYSNRHDFRVFARPPLLSSTDNTLNFNHGAIILCDEGYTIINTIEETRTLIGHVCIMTL